MTVTIANFWWLLPIVVTYGSWRFARGWQKACMDDMTLSDYPWVSFFVTHCVCAAFAALSWWAWSVYA